MAEGRPITNIAVIVITSSIRMSFFFFFITIMSYRSIISEGQTLH